MLRCRNKGSGRLREGGPVKVAPVYGPFIWGENGVYLVRLGCVPTAKGSPRRRQKMLSEMQDVMSGHHFCSQTERQALVILNGIKVVSNEVRSLIRALGVVSCHDDCVGETAGQVLDNLERLANLALLEGEHLSRDVSSAVAGAVRDGLQDACTCLQGGAVPLIFDRLQSVRDQAQAAAACTGHCSLGQSRQLARTLDGIDLILETLGQDEALTGRGRNLVSEARQAVLALALREGQALALPEFAG